MTGGLHFPFSLCKNFLCSNGKDIWLTFTSTEIYNLRDKLPFTRSIPDWFPLCLWGWQRG